MKRRTNRAGRPSSSHDGHRAHSDRSECNSHHDHSNHGEHCGHDNHCEHSDHTHLAGHREGTPDEPDADRRPAGRSRMTRLGAFTGAALAALLASSPVTVSVSLSPEPRTVVISQGTGQGGTVRPVCPMLPDQATLTR
jgi:hypothetical protein